MEEADMVAQGWPIRLPMLPTLLSTSVAGLENSKERTYFGAATLRNRLHVFGGQTLDYKVRSRIGLKGLWHTVAAVLEHWSFGVDTRPQDCQTSDRSVSRTSIQQQSSHQNGSTHIKHHKLNIVRMQGD